MSKKHQQHEEENQEARTFDESEREALIQQLKDSEAQVAEYKDGWARSQADFQNYRKRIERDNDLFKSATRGDIIKKVLPVLDDLERALQNRPADDAWADGVELVARKFLNILELEGVTQIQAKGAEFDPNLHEAVSHEPSDEVESGHVIEALQNGYMLDGRLIRPALVRVAQ
ncbi:MAG: nucleotide exchange factor GrpE [Anaerolineales bacterium]|nr:nucleotide exchange factor GrpE [Anaerolineales bacterium]